MAELLADYQKRKAAEQKTAVPTGPTPGFRAAAERNDNVQANATELGSPAGYGGGFRTPRPQLQEGQLSTGAQRFIPIDREFDQPSSSWKSGGQLPGSFQAPVPGRDLSEKDHDTGYDPSKPAFSNPVHVIRGMAQTWTGPSGEEYKTPQQANQSFIRAGSGTARPGSIPGYDPVGGPGFRAEGEEKRLTAQTIGEQQRLTQAAENKRPDLVTAADIAEEKQKEAKKAKVGTDFEGRALKRYGVYKDGKIARPAEEHVLRDLDEAKEYAMEQGNPQAGHNYMEWSQRLREMYPDVYATTMKTNPLAWRDIVITHGPRIPATATTAPAAPTGFTETDKFLTGLTGMPVGP